jgi:uncharacterized Fe-S center protein
MAINGFEQCNCGGISPDICINCNHLDYDCDDGIYTNFWCDVLERFLDDELQGRI